jgi:hypothetical protein
MLDIKRKMYFGPPTGMLGDTLKMVLLGVRKGEYLQGLAGSSFFAGF